jgi:hypothetical protein
VDVAQAGVAEMDSPRPPEESLSCSDSVCCGRQAPWCHSRPLLENASSWKSGRHKAILAQFGRRVVVRTILHGAAGVLPAVARQGMHGREMHPPSHSAHAGGISGGVPRLEAGRHARDLGFQAFRRAFATIGTEFLTRRVPIGRCSLLWHTACLVCPKKRENHLQGNEGHGAGYVLR